jgi:hypothetical protein
MKENNGLKIVAMAAFLAVGSTDTVSGASCVAPKKPTSINVSDITSNSVKISFKDYSGTEDYFKVKVKSFSFNKTYIVPSNKSGKTRGRKVNYTLTGLPSSKNFSVNVSAYRHTSFNELLENRGRGKVFTYVCEQSLRYINPSESAKVSSSFRTKSAPRPPAVTITSPRNNANIDIYDCVTVKWKGNPNATKYKVFAYTYDDYNDDHTLIYYGQTTATRKQICFNHNDFEDDTLEEEGELEGRIRVRAYKGSQCLGDDELDITYTDY